MQQSLEAPVQPPADGCPKAWTRFFQVHCDQLFQTALLLSADPDEAEASIAATLGSVDFSKPPTESELVILQEKIARQTIQNAAASESPKIFEARSLLQDGLQPVLQIQRFPRVCFVLRMLLGYATSSCAQMLSIDETAVRTLLRIAVLQLHATVSGTTLHQAGLNDPLERQGCGQHSGLRSFMSTATA